MNDSSKFSMNDEMIMRCYVVMVQRGLALPWPFMEFGIR